MNQKPNTICHRHLQLKIIPTLPTTNQHLINCFNKTNNARQIFYSIKNFYFTRNIFQQIMLCKIVQSLIVDRQKEQHLCLSISFKILFFPCSLRFFYLIFAMWFVSFLFLLYVQHETWVFWELTFFVFLLENFTMFTFMRKIIFRWVF